MMKYSVELLETKGKKHIIKLTGNKSDECNNNMRIYPHKILLESCKDFSSRCPIPGFLSHNQNDLEDASHLITKAEMIGKNLVATAEIIESGDSGRTLLSLLQKGTKLGASTRSRGRTELQDGITIIKELSIETIDVLSNRQSCGTKGVCSTLLQESTEHLDDFTEVQLDDPDLEEFEALLEELIKWN